MDTLLASVLSSFFLAFPAAQAESGEPVEPGDGGWYIGGGAGISQDADVTFDVFNSSVNRSGTVFMNHASVSLTLAAGYKFDNNIRLEGEVLRLPFGIDDVNYTQLDLPQDVIDMFPSLDDIVQGAGDLAYRGAVFNAFYDIDTGTKWVPYVGAGAGRVNLAVDTEVTVLDDTITGSGSGTARIIQLQAGVDYRINPRFAAFANYRWASIGDVSIADYAGPAANSSTLALNSYHSSNWQAGLKVRLGRR